MINSMAKEFGTIATVINVTRVSKRSKWNDAASYTSLFFLGEYSEGLKNGTGIEFFENGSVKHQGTWVKDKFQG